MLTKHHVYIFDLKAKEWSFAKITTNKKVLHQKVIAATAIPQALSGAYFYGEILVFGTKHRFKHKIWINFLNLKLKKWVHLRTERGVKWRFKRARAFLVGRKVYLVWTDKSY